ncbi:methyltransferase [Polaromonas sp. JS666]|uniref:class I SAM-dependent methyltransferase n=1 Tax=Polaromonas sp. (strain JS666 / ATCC BAA-500) TaxID=296591 RepID=UPI000880D7A3|nr:SAM-dependent methyltransferase [Polaromonas sp. JS666]SDM40911.1 Methyltransferase domain-containing protein [Polaromonas sp. JS666]
MPHAPVPGPVPAAGTASAEPYLLKYETVSGSGEDLQLRSLLDRQQFHDPLGEAEREGISSSAWPLFGLLWPSGRVLAHTMLSFELEGKRILELGCGLALASLVVHRRGGNITASDCHPLAAEFLLENLKLNQLPAMKYQAGNWSRANPLLERFDLIIGSDVLYDRGQPEALSRFIELHAQPRVEVLIVDPDRGNRASFNRRMDGLGYSRTETRVTQLPAGGSYKGRLLQYLRA